MSKNEKEIPKSKEHEETTLDKLYGLFLKIKNSKLDLDSENEELKKISLEIPDDYVDSGGLRKAHSVLKEIQGMKNTVVRKMLACNSLAKKTEYLLNLGIDYVLKTHPEITSLKNQESREMRAISSHEKLKEIYRFHFFHKAFYNSLELVLDNLKSGNDNIKKQIEVVGYQISIGEIREKRPFTRKGKPVGEELE